ncbi:MAG: lipase family alpha/beta hydrolase [Thermoleophilaceae bacterium]
MTHSLEVQVHEPDEAAELVRLSFEEVAGFVGGIQSMHTGIAGRAFRLTGPAAAPVRFLHDRAAGAVYGGLAGATRGLGRAAGAALARRPGWGGRVVSSTPQGAALVGVLSGLVGDALEKRRSALIEPMSVRVGGRPVAIDRGELARAFPNAGPRVVVFLHGLMETDWSWRRGSEPYGARLERDLGLTPVYVRYNTGRHVSHNGSSFAQLVEQFVAEWPVDVSEVALVGHSMGGLVARSAAHKASGDEMQWVRLVRHVVSIGTPHMGAPLEQFVHYASAGLAALPETRPVSQFLRRRSAGIRDLRRGSLVDEDWADCDPDALRAAACKEIPLLDGATHCFVTATITRSPRHPVGRLIGDFLVLQASGSGRSRTRRIAFDEDYGFHVGGAHHFALLNHPAVYDKLRDWLDSRPRELPAPA